MTVTQPGKNPTNKLTAASIAALTVSVASLVVRNLVPDWYDEAVFTALMPVTVFIAGYIVKDKPNVKS